MKFSIITPTFNRAHTIERAIRSILKQKHKNFEMIIIDDGSTDNTIEIITKYLNDPRIKYIGPNKNGGVNVARNIGLKSISNDSDWITFLDSDDEFLPDALENMKNTIENNPEYHYFRFAVIYDNGIKPCFSKYNGIEIDYKATLKQEDVSGEWVATLSKKIIDNGFLFEESINAFEGLSWFGLSKKEVCYYKDWNVLIVHTDTKGFMRIDKKNKEWYLNHIEGMKLHLEKFGKDYKRYAKKIYMQKLYALGDSYFVLGNYSLGLKYTYNAFKDDPLNPRIFRNILTFINFKKRV